MSLFDTEAWQDRMDARWFANGVDIAEAGCVDLVSIEDDAVTAHVTGSADEPYIVELRAPAGEGLCTCPAYDTYGACKHQAAVVTAVNALDEPGLQAVRDRMSRLRDGLMLDSREALVERLVDLARRNPNMLAILEG